MPKLKSHKSATKRYKVTGTGKIKRRAAGKGHLLQHKSASRKRKLSKSMIISPRQLKLVCKELPYMKYAR